MYGINIAVFVAVMIILPLIVGYTLFWNPEDKIVEGILKTWNAGMFCMYAAFEIPVLIGTFAGLSLKKTGIIYIGILTVVIIIGFVLQIKKRQRLSLKDKIKIDKFPQMDWWAVLLLVLVLAGIIYQIFYVSAYMHIDEDDAYYVGMAVTSYSTDTISVFHPYTGETVALKEMSDYVLTPYPVYWAMWCKIVDIPPAILMHSVLPGINIFWCYIVYMLLSGVLFSELDQRLEFMLIVIAANLFGAFSGFSSATFLLTRIWQGKAVYAAIFIPMFWYCWLKIRKMDGEKEQWRLLAVVTLASCLTSTMSLVITPVLFGAFGVEQLLERKKQKRILGILLCSIPLVILLIGEIYLKFGT
jgi:hypothetical protein